MPLQEMAIGLKLRIKEVEGLYYLFTKNKDVADLCLCLWHLQKAGFPMMRLIMHGYTLYFEEKNHLID